jgi:hypothetical protein
MLHACLCTICFAFCYTSWHFYAFSGTNLLTRCHSASSLFSDVFMFQKSYTGNILGIGRNKSRTSYFSRMKDEDRRRAGGGPEGHHTRGWRTLLLAVLGGGVGPLVHLWRCPFAYLKPCDENPKSIGNFPEEVPQLRRRHRRISGDRSLCSGTLPGRGSAPGAISINVVASTAISTNIAISHDEKGVVLPRGWGLYR